MRCRPYALLMLLGALVACTSPAAIHPASSSAPAAREPASRPDIYARITERFTDAIFLKPAATSQPSRTFDLAPLITQQVLTSQPAEVQSRLPAAVTVDSNGGLRFDTSHPAVCTAASVAILNGRPHDQLIYVWFYAPGATGKSPAWRAVRLTCDKSGFAAIAEALSSDESTAIVFVAKSVEQAAAAESGPPLSGRHFSIEANRQRQPDVVVARILEDGPIPMGPIVYLDAADRAITTLICRCMPSQLDNAVESVYYEMKPLHSLPPPLPRTAADLTSGHPERGDPTWLQHALRLPKSF